MSHHKIIGIYNVALNGDKVAAISKDPLQGQKVYDVSGKVVSPGFIDPHSHGMNNTSHRFQMFDGVTTAMDLEAGALPVSQFYDTCAKEGRVINYGCSVSHGSARIAALSPKRIQETGGMIAKFSWLFTSFHHTEWTHDLAEDQALQKIVDLVEQGIKEGGIGVGILHAYTPGAGTQEMLKLFELGAKYNVPTFTHTKNMAFGDPNSNVQSCVELVGLSAVTGCHAHVCHLNSISGKSIAKTRKVILEGKKAGVHVTTEAYPYGAASSAIGAEEFEPTTLWSRLQLPPQNLTRVKDGKTFQTVEEIIEARKENANDAVVCHFLNEDEDPKDEALMDLALFFPDAPICSDGLSWSSQDGSYYEEDVWPMPQGLQNHPRAAGSFSRFISKWCRERKTVSLLEAVRKCSLNPAQLLEKHVPSMLTKGRLQVGMDADVIVFDFDQIKDMATFKDPQQFSAGMTHVIVNGTFVVENGEHNSSVYPGRPVRAPIRT